MFQFIQKRSHSLSTDFYFYTIKCSLQKISWSQYFNILVFNKIYKTLTVPDVTSDFAALKAPTNVHFLLLVHLLLMSSVNFLSRSTQFLSSLEKSDLFSVDRLQLFIFSHLNRQMTEYQQFLCFLQVDGEKVFQHGDVSIFRNQSEILCSRF